MNTRLTLLTCLLVLAVSQAASAQRRGATVQTVKLTDTVYMLAGNGGNIGVSIGSDGVVLVDDQFAPATGLILDAVARLTAEKVRFVINTHWHGDHTGGNENLGQEGALIVAHENVRVRMSSEQFIEAFGSRTPPSPPAALPVVTFDRSMTLHWNDEDIRIHHVAPAHTDGDSLVHFVKSNVVHMGDVFFNGMYPFIDTGTGGSLSGMISAANRGLELTDDETKVIPGHGPLSNRAGLEAFRDMLVTVDARIAPMIKAGKTREEVVAAQPTKDLDEAWGGGFMQPDQWVGIVYDGYAAAR
jgi:glyoxylase-like metal-dependent hydrolase (beta-lactamase superfamily II)